MASGADVPRFPRWARAVAVGGLMAALMLPPNACWALGLPPAYGAVLVQPSGGPGEAEFDLGPAVQLARQDGKRLYVYLGADDCPYCRRYEAFLQKNADELLPHFAGYLLVDLRGSLKVNPKSVFIRSPLGRLSYADFQRAIGDERARLLVYPNVWLLDADLKPLMQMPAGAGTFQTVPEQLEILRLEQ